VLTAALIDELIASGHVVAGSRKDLGSVGGGIAVRAGDPHPDVSTPAALAASLQAASGIYLPDPAIATAGRQFLQMTSGLGIAAAVAPKLRRFPNGYTAMTRMAEASSAGDIGYTQITEIKLVRGVELVAPLPRSLQIPTVYSLGIYTLAADSAAARAFAERLSGPGAQSMLAAAGFL
jgi:molybdate transport system substrate-binding protein